MKKVVFVVSELSAGGAARVLSTLANHFAGLPGHEVGVISHRAKSGYAFDPRVERLALFEDREVRSELSNKLARRIIYLPRLSSALRRMKPDAVMVLLRGMNWRLILLCRVLRIRVVATEHINHMAERGFFSWIERRLVYRLASSLVVLTEFDRYFYSQYIADVRRIPNPLSLLPVAEVPLQQQPVILAMGGMDRWWQKGFDNLLRIYSRISARYPQWRLKIVGPGETGRKYLESMCSELGIAERVEFSGFTTQVAQELQGASIFALTSRFEGFSMVLLEAMSQGCCCLSFDCKAGPSELLSDGFSGALVADQDCDEFAERLAKLIESPASRRQLSQNAIAESRRYDLERIGKAWESVLFCEAENGMGNQA